MTIGITPVGGIAARQRIGNDVVGIAIPSSDIHEPFLTRVGKGHVGSVSNAIADVLVDIADGFGRTVGVMDNRVGTTTVEHFAGAVLVPVEGNGIPLLVGTVTDVRSAVNPPQTSVVDGGGIHLNLAIHLLVRGREELVLVRLVLALHNKVHLPISIHVAQRNVVDGVVRHRGGRIALLPYGHSASCLHVRHGKLEILLLPRGDGSTLRTCRTVPHGSNGVGTGGASTNIHIVRSNQVLGNQGTIPIQVVGHIVVLIGLYTPTDIYSR